MGSLFTLTTHLAYLPISKPSETKNHTPNMGNSSYANLAEQLRLGSDKLEKLHSVGARTIGPWVPSGTTVLEDAASQRRCNAEEVVALNIQTAELQLASDMPLLEQAGAGGSGSVDSSVAFPATRAPARETPLSAPERASISLVSETSSLFHCRLFSAPKHSLGARTIEAAAQKKAIIQIPTEASNRVEEAGHSRVDAADEQNAARKWQYFNLRWKTHWIALAKAAVQALWAEEYKAITAPAVATPNYSAGDLSNELDVWLSGAVGTSPAGLPDEREEYSAIGLEITRTDGPAAIGWWNGKKGRIAKGMSKGHDKKKDGNKKDDKKEHPGSHRITLAIAEPNAVLCQFTFAVPRKYNNELRPGSMGCRPTPVGLETYCGFAAE
ncbi:hypothetical protein FN846DRAFT_903359 [Sphaerosporella brunnea]|uniref:Uncharacterized protein n=1 Tax=Sphaerosporella brunnea TaxID=1250544 RepID=A0A5J5F7C4_9PEZI|nr:hypothetical protein FN846DRAFT_903359 [Sphaerosporella brunnea]